MLTNRFTDAMIYAIEVHREQVRKGTDIPYCSHLLAVAGLVLEHGGSETEAIAALLHDTIEDTPATYESLAESFGVEVADIVRACTDDIPGTDRSSVAGWRTRKEAYIAHLTMAPLSVLLVSCADKLHNARSILSDLHTHGVAVFGRFKAGHAETIWYYDSLAKEFQARARDHPRLAALSRDLGRVVQELKTA